MPNDVNIQLTGHESPQWLEIFRALARPDVTELTINDRNRVYLTLSGHRRVPLGARFKDGTTIGNHVQWNGIEDFEQSLMNDVAPRITRYGDPYDKSYCIYEGSLRLRDDQGKIIVKARFHCLKPPVCEFPAVTIAKQSTTLTTIDSLIESGSINQAIAEIVKTIMKNRRTIVFSGGTGAGKTTFLQACAKLISKRERIIICEDTPELIFDTIPNTVNLMSYPKQPGKNENEQASLSWVVQQTARMRTDRIIIGETRGAEFADFITAANSGFDGSMTTLHANNPRMALNKMASFMKRAPGNAYTPMSVINSDISSAVNYIIQLGVYNNKYRLMQIDEVQVSSANNTDAAIKTTPIIKYDKKLDEWNFEGYPTDEKVHNGILKIIPNRAMAMHMKAGQHMVRQSF